MEAGSGEVVSRVEKEQSNPQADLLVTLPPFIQKADKSGLLQPSGADTTGIAADQVGPDGNYVPIVDNALSFIANPGANPQPATWDDLLKPEFKGKLQYSTPGQAGDGTAVLVLLQHLLRQAGRARLPEGKLQANNVGPSSSTGKLQPKVSNGELLVANGDVQMNLASIKDDGSKFDDLLPGAGRRQAHHRSRCPTSPVSPRARRTPTTPRSCWRSCSPRTSRRPSHRRHWASRSAMQIAPHPRSPPAPNTPAAVLDGVDVWVPDWNAVLADLDADLAAYQKATGS